MGFSRQGCGSGLPFPSKWDLLDPGIELLALQPVSLPSEPPEKPYFIHKSESESQLCPTLCDPMDYTDHGILQARILEWVAYPFSNGSSWSRNQTGIFCIADGFFTNGAIKKLKNLTSFDFEHRLTFLWSRSVTSCGERNSDNRVSGNTWIRIRAKSLDPAGKEWMESQIF